MDYRLLLKENVYGHRKRLCWLASQLERGDRIVELGCGTGTMITLPLLKAGYDIYGIDLDQTSVDYGKKVFATENCDPRRIEAIDIAEMEIEPNVVIASEVLEHIPDHYLQNMLATIAKKLWHGGKLLVTVPNGYGWFELESLLWYKTGMEPLLAQLARVVRVAKFCMGIDSVDYLHPSTLSSSPHVQRFTLDGICKIMRQNGFVITHTGASVAFCGPFGNAVFTGVKLAMKWNCKLGDSFPRYAASFYIAAKLEEQ